LREETWLKTLQRFDMTGKVEKVAQVSRKVSPTFRAFYAPKEFRDQTRGHSLPFKASVVDRILSNKQISLLPSGRLKLRPQGKMKSSLTLHGSGLDWVCRQKDGIGGAFYKKISGPKNRLLIFENPIQFLGSGRFLDKLAKDKIPFDVYVPMKPLRHFLKEKRQFVSSYSKVSLVKASGRMGWGKEGSLDFHEGESLDFGEASGFSYLSIDELLAELILGRGAARKERDFGI
jgi:hypothetical protein